MERVVISGLAASGGRAFGRIYEKKEAFAAVDASVGHAPSERGRFFGALNAAKRELMMLSNEAKGSLGEKESEIFLIHSLFLEDEDLIAAAERALMATHTAEYALIVARDYAIAALLATGDPTMMARCDDLRDVASRVSRHLSGQGAEARLPEADFIFAATDITPSEVLALQKTPCVGIVLREGALGSHAAILANAMALPMLIRAAFPTALGEYAILNCDESELIVSPEREEIEDFSRWREAKVLRDEALLAYRDRHFVYPSGRRLTIAANIGSDAELDRALLHGAEGVGLFRSEFLFMESERAPSEDEQYEAYRRVVERTDFAVIRLVDVGADKVPRWMTLPKEQNPALGLRGVRLFYELSALFDSQLRAILRASLHGRVVILLPMVISPREVISVRERIDSLCEALRGEGLSGFQYGLGVMIETPAAALCCRELSGLCEYFSIGSNDLFQYTMAIDRENPRALSFAERHPAPLLRLIDEVVAAAHETGIKVSLCGELAGDPSLTEWLLSLEFDVLSLSPSSILPIKEQVAKFLKNE